MGTSRSGFSEPEDRSPATHFLPQQQALVSEARQQLPPRSWAFRSAAQHSQGEAMQNRKLLSGKENPAWTTAREHSLTRPGRRGGGRLRIPVLCYFHLPLRLHQSPQTTSQAALQTPSLPKCTPAQSSPSGSIFTLRTFEFSVSHPTTP